MLDVAKACGVSYQTVSRVINDSPDVSAKTRRQVQKAIQSLGYHPNQLARSLKTRRSSILEVITFGVETYIPRELIVAMGRAAIAHGYSLMFTDIPHDDPEAEKRLYAHLNSGLCEAAIVTAPVESMLFEKITANPPNLPMIQIRNKRGSPAPSVMIDQYYGSQLGVQHLLDLGHRQIAEISGPLNYHEAYTRHTAFLDTLQALDLAPVGIVEAAEWMPQHGYLAANQLLERGAHFSALVISNDYLALGAMLALNEHGLCVPDDISIVGFDDTPESAYYMPPLTTVRQDYEALGYQSIHYLVELINHQDTPAHQRILMPQLIVRQSTRAHN
ncbi:MAG: LacI family DNA-binding transcriptional regulator [Anaerolineales bacterium]|nr:LacI family DNA-binding transcriptional regulator [Anaerolineales bacterium]